MSALDALPAGRSTTVVEADLDAGTLRLEIDGDRTRFDELCGLASRRNRRRGFLFVSRVLGKHIPVRPSVMRGVHRELAAALAADLRGPVVFIGLAETATALGFGVFERWCERTARTDALFLHTTRYHLARRAAVFAFVEPHSHATDHLVHEPEDESDRALLAEARTLVLVDDEASTGSTFANLASAFRDRHPALEQVRIAVLTDWMGEERRLALRAEIEREAQVVSLLRGRYAFTARPGFDCQEVSVTGDTTPRDTFLPGNHGREGVRGVPGVAEAVRKAREVVRRGERVLVLGTGEFMYPPFKVAEALEADGHDVWFQATTRSPVVTGGAVRTRLQFVDNYGDGIPNFVYNVDRAAYDRVLVGYETAPLPAAHRLVEMLDAVPLFF